MSVSVSVSVSDRAARSRSGLDPGPAATPARPRGLDEGLVAGLFGTAFVGRDAALRPVYRWTRRLAQAGLQRFVPALPEAPDGPVPADPLYETALDRCDSGSPEDLLGALTVFDALGAAATAARVRAQLRAAGLTGCHARRWPPPGPIRPA